MFTTVIIGLLAVIAIVALIAGIRWKRDDGSAGIERAQAELDKAKEHLEEVRADRYGNDYVAREKVRDAERDLERMKRGADDDSATFIAFAASGVAALIAALVFVFSSFYTQDVGESKVQVSWNGDLVGQTTETGLHFKWPWVGTKTFDVRNNIVSYIGGADEQNVEYGGNPRTGPQITFQDREGVSGNMDLTIRYSLDPEYVTDIYTEFRTQEQLTTRVINEVARSVARESAVTRDTIEVYNERADLAVEIREGLEERIRVQGFIIEDVAIQEIQYSGEVRQRFDDAQAARIEIDRAEAQQRAAEVQAETAVIEAQGRADANVAEAEGQAEANRLLTESLSEEILRQRYIDAIANGSTFVVPEGSDPLVSVNP